MTTCPWCQRAPRYRYRTLNRTEGRRAVRRGRAERLRSPRASFLKPWISRTLYRCLHPCHDPQPATPTPPPPPVHDPTRAERRRHRHRTHQNKDRR